MGDSSGEEFFSAPESDEEGPTTSRSELETLDKLSRSLGDETHTDTAQTSHDKNTDITDEKPGIKENTRDLGEATANNESGGDSPRQEFVSGLDNRFVSDDQEVVEGDKVELSEEQIKELKEKANALKADGNAHFKNEEYDDAIECYSKAIEIYPLSVCNHEIAVCYANRATCHMKLDNHQAVIDDCTKTLELEPTYLKAILRRAQASETLEKYEDALNDYKKALEIDPTQSTARQAVMYLPDKVKEQNEKLKDEMLGKLKELGNAVLGPFGLSTNNFQLQQNQTGGYSINFKR